MAGISDLGTLLKQIKPKLQEGEFVYCKPMSEKEFSKLNLSLNPLMIYREEEGITFILKKEHAELGNIPYLWSGACITLTVHSDLNSVGFLSAILPKLEGAGISANVVSAYYHDHLFVPFDKAKEAMKVLENLSK